MKILLTILLLGVVSLCFSQGDKVTPNKFKKQFDAADSAFNKEIKFSAYERAKVISHQDFQKEVSRIQRQAAKIDSIYIVFIREDLAANGIDLSRVSVHADSLKITPDGIFLKLKRKK